MRSMKCKRRMCKPESREFNLQYVTSNIPLLIIDFFQSWKLEKKNMLYFFFGLFSPLSFFAIVSVLGGLHFS